MNPWHWLLWSAAALIVLFLGSAIVVGVIQAARRPKQCERCGYRGKITP